MKTLAAQIATIAIGALAGVIAWLAQMPLPWMLGPMIATTALAVTGVPLAGPMRLRPFMMPVIGVLLGSRISAEALAGIVDWWPAVIILVPYLGVTATISFQFYRRIGRFDPITSFFAAMPGGLNDMIQMGGEAGGDERHIALAHATRILVVIGAVVLFFGLFMGISSERSGADWVSVAALTWFDALVLLACALAGVPLGKWLRLPAAIILGPMLLSGAAHVTHLVEVPPPSLFVVAAQIVIGTAIGCRFLGTSAREVGRDMALGAGSALLMIASAVGFAMLAALVVDIEAAELFLAFSPGGLTEMSLLALAMGQEVAFVTVMHLARITLVVIAAKPMFALFVRRPA